MHATDIARRFGSQPYSHSWRRRCPSCDCRDTFSPRARHDGRVPKICDRKNRYEAVVLFSNRTSKNPWSAAVIDSVRFAYPTAF
jgi:hypothetical protein